MVQSMTGFASGQGAKNNVQWVWDIRSVNAKGLDIRLRVPDWIPGLEADLKPMVAKCVSRGNVSVSLRLTRDSTAARFLVNSDALQAALTALTTVEKTAMQMGLTLKPSTASDLLSVKGVIDQGADDADVDTIKQTVLKDFVSILADFVQMREQEGQTILKVLSDQIDQIDTLVQDAMGVLQRRKSDMDASFRQALQRVIDNTDGFDPDRVAQEIALLAVKTDVTEEIDRLRAHVEAARKLLNKGDKIGRKLDFLSQEFNREANTLCAKSQHKDLTLVGLELKAVIDQMREQVQNLE